MTSPLPAVELMQGGEVAAVYQVSGATVSRWGSDGRLESVRTPGGHKRYFAVEVNALLAGANAEDARKLALAEKARLAGGKP